MITACSIISTSKQFYILFSLQAENLCCNWVLVYQVHSMDSDKTDLVFHNTAIIG